MEEKFKPLLDALEASEECVTRCVADMTSDMERYLQRLDALIRPFHTMPAEATETVRLLARTVEYKHEQLLELAAHCDAYNACRCVLDGRRKKKEDGDDDEN